MDSVTLNDNENEDKSQVENDEVEILENDPEIDEIISDIETTEIVRKKTVGKGKKPTKQPKNAEKVKKETKKGVRQKR